MTRRLVAQGGTLNTRPKPRSLFASAPRVLKPESPKRGPIQEEIFYGVRTRKGRVRGSGIPPMIPPRT